MFLFDTQMISIILVKILKKTIQIKNRKILMVFDDMIADMFSNKNVIIQ